MRGRSFALVVFLFALFTLLLFAGCGSRPPIADEGNGVGPGGGGGALAGPCGPEQEGKTVACHVETGRIDNYVNCFSGVQVCQGGVWGPCGGPDGTLTTRSLDTLGTLGTRSSGGLHILAGSPTASGCQSNPCNPYCLGEDKDAGGLTPGAFSSTSILGTITTPEAFPGGADGPKNAMGPSWNATTKTWACSNTGTAPPGTQAGHPPTNYKTCSSDYCCASAGASANTCQPWVIDSGDNPAAASCIKPSGAGSAGVDYTVGLSCTDTTGKVHIPVCNRGENDANTGTLLIGGYSGNPNSVNSIQICQQPGLSAALPADRCYLNLATKPIPAGKCIDIQPALALPAAVPGVPGLSCNTGFTGGNSTMMVNPPGTTGYTQLAEGDFCNNYGFRRSTAATGNCSLYGTQPPPPASASNTYTATCPAGSEVRWNQFAYSVSPNTGAAGADYDVGFTFTTSTGVIKTIRAKNLTNYPGTCAFSAVTSPACTATPPADSPCNTNPVAPATNKTCPTNLATLLGAGATAPSLTLDLSLAAGATTSPTVNSWSITYSCIPKE